MARNEEALRQLIGRTIKGIVVKRDPKLHTPMGQVMLVFTDDTAYEFYSDRPILTASGLDKGGMKHAREYLCPPRGTMEIYAAVSVDDD